MKLLEELYKEILLRHYKHPLNFRALEDASVRMPGVNPSCGDSLELYLRLEDGRIAEAAWQGQGCAISMTSASLMSELIKGKTPLEALELTRKFKAMIVDGAEPAPELGDLKALAGVHKLHARVKCATLAWNTLEEALKE
ncbi:Fe-S cluster assembly sulfur transfer protein SufU [Calidithermus timidus]|jgi:nitrogen fixation NifU-like protein|uniref:Fe-S cluster assembly sulfur transfer protein SufU n=1 Tax=Calidithermus timidus TaxID=307124 RepID=UPI0003610E5E|nr:SUF system NifU family Fe-S cluster assembly protein [Calidithermus timidus]